VVKGTKEKYRGNSRDSADASKAEFFWSSTIQPEQLVSMQRVAECSGLSYSDPASKLSIHPIFGAWVSYRAVVVFVSKSRDLAQTASSYVLPPPIAVPCLLSTNEQDKAARAMKKALYSMPDQDLCTMLHGTMKGDRYKDWIALRDVVDVGREFRFSENQLLYHYTKDLACLERASEDK
jgi:hypothetical protein